MPSSSFAIPNQQELKNLHAGTALAVELDGYPELGPGKHHGEHDGLPIYDYAPSTYIELVGDSLRKTVPSAVQALNIGKKCYFLTESRVT